MKTLGFRIAIVGVSGLVILLIVKGSLRSRSRPLTTEPTTSALEAAASAAPPVGYRNFTWGAPPNKSLKLFMPSTDEGVTMYVPASSRSPEALFDIPVAEEDYAFIHGRFYQGDAYVVGAPNLAKMKSALVHAFGHPSFTNESLQLWKWDWPTRSIHIQLYFEDRFSRTTVTFSDFAIK